MKIVRPVVTCDRCAFGSEKLATTHRVFALDDRYYKLDLCEPHAATFDRELGMWTRLAAECDAPVSAPVPKYDRAEQREITAGISSTIEEARRAKAESTFEAKRGELAHREEEERTLKLIPGALKWWITSHARQRMTERDFTFRDMMETVCNPGTVHRQPWRGPDIAIHQRGDCRVVVDEKREVIITVIDRSSVLETAETAHLTLGSVTA